MALTPCGKGHFFDPEVNGSCPYCGVDGLRLDIGATAPLPDLRPGGGADAGRTVRAGQPQGGAGPADGRTRPMPGVSDPPDVDNGVTRALWPKRLGGIDPVVGWLVCIAGPDKGRDFRIHTERNFIGRAPNMDVVIASDASVSRENHAVVSYNPKRHTFALAPGEARGLTYLNGDELLGAAALTPYDQIEIGSTTLVFVPFCGERFTWPVAEAAETPAT